MDMFPSDSDWDSTSDSGSELGFLYDERADSILSSLEESISKIDDLLSFERGFARGDIVSMADPCGQMGRVIKVQMSVDLENFQGKIIKNIDSKNLLKVRSVSVGDYVVNGPWVGKVDKTVDNVSIVFDNGTNCEVIAADQGKIIPISPLEDSMYLYYPGQRVQVKHSALSKPTNWLCGAWKENWDLGTVSAVKTGLVYVDWLACVLGSNISACAPQHVQDANNLTLLPSFSHENWQLGDWCMLPVPDVRVTKKLMVFDASTLKLIKDQNRVENGSNFKEIFVIAKTKTKVDVLWQDGSCSTGLDSQCLVPINANAHDFWPGQFVLEKVTCDDLHVSNNRKWGVVISVDAKERTVKVKWAQACDVAGNPEEETASGYELIEHPDFSYCYGDIVYKNDNQADSFEGKDSSRDQIGYNCGDYLSCIGCVWGFKDGAVQVKWASGIETKVAPNEIFQIDKYESSTANSVSGEQSAEVNFNHEMIDLGKQSSSLHEKDLLNSDGNCGYKSDTSSFFLPQSAIGFLTSIAATIFGPFGSTSVSSFDPQHSNQSKTLGDKSKAKNVDLDLEPLLPAEKEMQQLEITISDLEVNHVLEQEHQSPFGGNVMEHFRQFEMVDDCSDHHFIDSGCRGITLSQLKRSWLKKVQQEWSTLKKDLPGSIYVRVFEERMDLIQAAIVGAPGTPYHDGVFFFDIYLPPDYPNEPPLVHYRSGGLRVNPNLYESGKVCLSLLNTWTGTGNEVWNPGSSNILQVLLSLQALVLNEKPYFNEAGYDKQIGKAEGEMNSVSYNENTFLMTWKSMLYLVRKPPKHFEELIEEHLRQRSEHILSVCKAYMEGAPVAFPIEYETQKGSSTGFKIMLRKLFPKLVEAFSAKGIDCSQFAET